MPLDADVVDTYMNDLAQALSVALGDDFVYAVGQPTTFTRQTAFVQLRDDIDPIELDSTFTDGMVNFQLTPLFPLRDSLTSQKNLLRYFAQVARLRKDQAPGPANGYIPAVIGLGPISIINFGDDDTANQRFLTADIRFRPVSLSFA